VKPLGPDYALPTDAHVNPNPADLMLRGRLEGTPPAANAAGFEVR